MASFTPNNEVINDIRQRAKDQLLAIGFLIEGDAKKIQTNVGYVDTGRSRASITTNWTDSGEGRKEGNDGVAEPSKEEGKFIVVVGSNVEYFPYIELGTKSMSPGAMLRRAFERHASKLRRLGR
jgi:hypothetical protein